VADRPAQLGLRAVVVMRVLLAGRAQLVRPVLLAHLWQVRRVRPDPPETPVLLGPPVLLVMPEAVVRWDRLAQQVMLGRRGLEARPVPRDLLDLPAVRARLARMARRGQLDRRVLRVRPALLRPSLAPRALLDRLDLQAPRVRLARQVRRGRLDPPGLMARTVRLGQPVLLRALRALRGQLALPVRLVRHRL
jgi:hypothetical protein